MSGEYRTIVADPPWAYDGFARSVGGRWADGTSSMGKRSLPYPSLDVEALAALPVATLADDNARLFLWTTNRYLPDSFGIVTAWGFNYVQLLTWHKTGNPSPFGGSVAPPHAEYVLVGVRGRPALLDRLPSCVLAIDTNPAVLSHSQKPEAWLDYFEAVSPGPYLELFARRQRLGWDTWGNEALEHVSLDLVL